MIDALLVYPRLGSMDSLVVDLPLSIVYAATASVKKGYDVQLIDLRGGSGDWKKDLKHYLDQGVTLLGISVMTGQPLINAKDISLFVRQNYPKTRIVWGGPHVTVLPGTIHENYIDFIVRGDGSNCLANLIQHLKNNNLDFSDIKGLSYKQESQIFHNEKNRNYEILSYQDLPYHLLELSNPIYGRAYSGQLMFSMYASIGCPYQCTFCISPTVYKEINGPKWLRIPDEKVVEHIEYVINKFGARNICFIDDTSFPDLKHMQRIFQKIIDRQLKVTLEFRGARINEMDKMDDDFIRLMIAAGTRVLKVGAESGSNQILNFFGKGITREQILQVNKKFARHKNIIIDYNFFCGAPGETYYDLLETKNLVLNLLKDNSNAYYSFCADWKPIPGSKILDYAKEQLNYQSPQTLEEWAQMDSFDSKNKIIYPWYTARHNNLIKMMQLSSLVMDNKIIKETASNNRLSFKFLRLLARLYRPISFLRLKFNFYSLMLEYTIYRQLIKLFPKMQKN